MSKPWAFTGWLPKVNFRTIAHPDESPAARIMYYSRFGDTPFTRSRTCIDDAAWYSTSHAPELACEEVFLSRCVIKNSYLLVLNRVCQKAILANR